LAGFRHKKAKDMLIAPSEKWTSTERHHFLVLHGGHWMGSLTALNHNDSIGRLYGQKGQWPYCYHLLKMRVIGWSTNFGLA
jgi:hypothetical protein